MSSNAKLDVINEALTRGHNPDLRLENLLQSVLETFDADRAWLVYPCDPAAKHYRAPKEVTKPQYPGAAAKKLSVTMTPLVSQLMQKVLSSTTAVAFDPGDPLLSELKKAFSIQSQLVIAITPEIGQPWLFGIHQCSHPRYWKVDERKLFAEIANRISDTLTNYLLYYEHKQNEAQYRTLFEFSHDGLIIIDEQGKSLLVNQSFCRFTGYTQHQVLASTFVDKVRADSKARIEALFQRLFQGHNFHCEMQFLHENNSVIDVEIHVSLIQYHGQKAALTSVRDITYRKQTEREQQNMLSIQAGIMEATADGILVVSHEHKVIRFNQKFVQIWALDKEQLNSEDPQEIQQAMNAKRLPPEESTWSINSKQNYNQQRHEITRLSDGKIVEVSSRPYKIGRHIQGLVWSFRDITQAHTLSEKLNYQASHDPLTQLINRHQFDVHLHQILDVFVDEETTHVLCYLDLDQFKIVNDSCGHMAGDELLKQLSSLMLSVIRKQDVLARLGGDEFGLLLMHCNIEQAERIVTTLHEEITQYIFCWQDRRFNVGASIGVVEINQSKQSISDVLVDADSACYTAKNAGRNTIYVHRPEQIESSYHHSQMQQVKLIQQALEHNHFQLWAQPIDTVAGSEHGVHLEILLRLKTPQGKMYTPGQFLATAERYDMAIDIDRWVIRNLFAWLDLHPHAVKTFNLISINLSGQSLADKRLLPFIKQALANTAFPSHKICFEITETAAISNLNEAKNLIVNLQSAGCLFSLDDFGSGLSSFAYLKNFPVDFLKIDGQFVRDMADDLIDFAMVKSINEIGQVMGKKTIAEYVESKQILACLNQLGVDYAQGYFIGKPRPLDEVLQADL